MKRRRRKRCLCCGELFMPDNRVGARQKVCSSQQCQEARKQEYSRQWEAGNPERNQGRYVQVKEWLDLHPGYLRRYREAHPFYQEQNRVAQRERNHYRNRPIK